MSDPSAEPETLRSAVSARHLLKAAKEIGLARDLEHAIGNQELSARLNDCVLALYALALRKES